MTDDCAHCAKRGARSQAIVLEIAYRPVRVAATTRRFHRGCLLTLISHGRARTGEEPCAPAERETLRSMERDALAAAVQRGGNGPLDHAEDDAAETPPPPLDPEGR